ncbi:MAG: hypothetical protein ACYCY1_10870 [Sulfuriferula sp.]
MKTITIVFLFTAWYAFTQAQAAERTPVADARPLMIAAIDSPAGVAHGVLAGDMADAITRRFKATSPIYIDVSTERRYAQSGCSRLKVVFWQEGVLLPGAPAPRKQTIEMGINYCRDGLPPKSLL